MCITPTIRHVIIFRFTGIILFSFIPILLLSIPLTTNNQKKIVNENEHDNQNTKENVTVTDAEIIGTVLLSVFSLLFCLLPNLLMTRWRRRVITEIVTESPSVTISVKIEQSAQHKVITVQPQPAVKPTAKPIVKPYYYIPTKNNNHIMYYHNSRTVTPTQSFQPYVKHHSYFPYK